MSYERRIEKGMALLDVRLPGWERKIDLGILDLQSGCDCVLGQLALDLGVRHDPDEDPDEKFIKALRLLWPTDSSDAMLRQEQAAKRAVDYGFNVDHYWETSELTAAWLTAIGKRLTA